MNTNIMLILMIATFALTPVKAMPMNEQVSMTMPLNEQIQMENYMNAINAMNAMNAMNDNNEQMPMNRYNQMVGLLGNIDT